MYIGHGRALETETTVR